MKITRYHKARHGGIVATTTNAEPMISRLKERTNRKDEHGYILRMTQAEAEKDPKP